ncbi:hypothetical protein NLG97_g3392 [Lecanicillium saksenae]|uniref:Uncharacterized protein n=1 Tax=Lecanicillium saksenae TaxID=468837 RepID=A0ACC1R0X8_9HYPO|nr:hypothetical protein NLG97_g3392 [Lecanicillium saksenae]
MFGNEKWSRSRRAFMVSLASESANAKALETKEKYNDTRNSFRIAALVERTTLPKILPKIDLKALEFQDDLLGLSDGWPLPLGTMPPNPNDHARKHMFSGDGNDFPLSESFASCFSPEDWFPELALPFDSAVVQKETTSDGTESSTPAAICDVFSSSSDTASPLTTQAHWLQRNGNPTTISTLGAQWQNIVLSQTFSQTGKEAEALHYYMDIYPTMTVSKNVNWTTYRIILLKNSQDPLTMHFLLATSLMDLATLKNYEPAICCAAQSHAKAGMRLLRAALDPSADSDPVTVMAAALFLYRYIKVTKDLDATHMSEWSRDICNYVERNQLDDFCRLSEPSAVLPSGEGKIAHNNMSQQMKVHLARLILWTFYEDVFAAIGGYGGFLARRMCDAPARARDVYQHSSAELECYWGKDYPEQQIIDDVENAPIINFLYEVIALYAEVNKIAVSPSHSAQDIATVEMKIEKLEACSRPLFRLTTITVQPRSRIMLNADYMVPYFYALRIYSYRCFLVDHSFDQAAPTIIQSCVSSIVQLAQRCLSRGPAEAMQARFQWPLFMAGIETTDNVYKEWINTKFKSLRVSAAFTHIWSLQEKSGRRISMSLLSEILSARNAIQCLKANH